jgi:predicted nucleic-acid-binding protein
MAYLDTNVVVRLIVGDDLAQCKLAEQLLASEPCWVSPSVLMETEWVLRAAYHLDPATIHAALSELTQVENIELTEITVTQLVLEAYGKGLDFADALHALQTSENQQFASFDKKLARSAQRAGLRRVLLLGAEPIKPSPRLSHK